MVSPPMFDHEKLDVYQLELNPDQYRVRENASGVAQSFEDDDEHEDE